MRFKNFDLNLLMALDLMIEERSVSAAANRMNISQSAMSSALARLRAHFQDELLVPSGRAMVATAYAQSLAGPVSDLLRQIEATVGEGMRFDPATSRRTFSITASDYVIEIMLADVVRRIVQLAPGVKLHVHFQGAENPIHQVITGQVDLVIAPDYLCPPDHPRDPLFTDVFVVVGWCDNPALTIPLDARAFAALPQVAVRFDMGRDLVLSEQFSRSLGFDIDIEVLTPSFSIVPELIVGTHRIAVLPRRLACKAAARLPIKIVETTFDGPLISEMMLYNRVRANDVGLSWLRNVIAEVAFVDRNPPSNGYHAIGR